ncbi:oligopeptide ABC transporter substrate-binding protein [Bacillus sp. FJAT-22090]|uniref:oligopeptide ABC transporter substrate-binding protein n=1 Tax=Bacillus sp. FJAT-22090 TaxID=1581038 RepID=UPI0011AB1879|nr:oligopeptide ABC transporter substrate-binding protein [Bacillus sp. FJAT-22090]
MNKKSLFWLIAMLLVFSVFLVACNSKEESSEPASDVNKEEDKGTETAPPAEDDKKGGTLVYAIDAPPEGLFNYSFYGIATDAEVISFFDEGLIKYDENLSPQPNIASWETEDNKKFKFTFKQGVKFHNGDELTVNDWVFTLKTLASPDYDGPRYSAVQDIEGAPAFREGKATEISGINIINDYEIEITFDKARVNNLTNLWTYVMPSKAFADVPVAEMSAHELVRTKPIGLGAFKVNKIVPGESVEFVRNEDYWNGEVNLDKVILRVVDNTSVVGALQNGDVQMISLQPVTAPEVEKLDNIEIKTAPGLSYYYVGFKLGKFDNNKLAITEENPKYQSKQLRQAMMYAINRQEWVDAFFFGYGKPVSKPVPSAHWISADESELNTYDYDPEKAKALLDEAGYVDVDGDGKREDPKGEKFVVKFSHYATGNPTFEARAKALTQYWEEVGLAAEVEMTDVNLYYDLIEKDDPSIETFFGGWSTGADPDPSATQKSDQIWNYTRYNNPETDKLLTDALDVEIVGTDTEKRKQLYVEWQKVMNEEVPMLYIAELEEILAVSKTVGGVTIDVSGTNPPAEWYLNK